MKLVKVWNDNIYPFKQDYKGEIIEIPAKGYIEMIWDEAIAFKSYPSPMAFDGMGQQDPKSFKMIRVEGTRDDGEAIVAFRSHKDGSLHATRSALEAYESQFDDSAFADTEGAKIAGSKRIKKTTTEATA